MLRVAGRRLSSSAVAWRSSQTTPAFVSGSHPLFNNNDDSSSDGPSRSPNQFFFHSHIPSLIREIPATVAAVKNPSSKIVYDEYNHERYPPGDPSKRAFAYFILTGGRFVYASLIRLLVLKFVLSMSASKDVLALASLEVDLSSIEPGTTVTVKWRGKPVFIRRRTEDDIKLANSVDVQSLRDPQQDAERVKNPEWLVVVGIRKGPAPYNLEVPTYSFLSENKLLSVLVGVPMS
ncbi:cytochrome b-c1 complex subunit Rieske-4 mitochondrial-like [Prunus yedoensis var. nudiflora]|uniref:Cytochrome b-c1 complex subunit Rieske-4 mitochondrial-like n=1 Tax=Prunus yedoensis var. nudiflora TaxID=2094558 RepID=A0A314Y3P5_PRUYE|nr:cytochrome b-c1 complex subunit Rieske-4 mitochondrial-like [Prunus yedoensis var. nudiflora]